MLITPRVSEKSYKLANDNVYVFDVPLTSNKAQVTKTVEAEHQGVKVKDVRLMVVKGKPKAVNRGKRSRPTVTNRKDSKKAYVTLSEGQIKVAAFEEIDNQVKAEQTEKVKTETKVDAGAETKKAGLLTRRRAGRRGDK
jgi:large subunit ribosomal protein L23